MIRKFFYLWLILTAVFMGSNLLYAYATAHNAVQLTSDDLYGLLYSSLLFMFFISLCIMLIVWWLGTRKQPQKQQQQ